MNNIYIGISGKKGSGKDTLASFLAEEFKQTEPRVIQIGFADFVREEAASFLAMSRYTTKLSASEYLEDINKPENKEYYRPLLQFIGDLRIRESNELYWCRNLRDRIDYYKGFSKDLTIAIVPDVRYPHMADWIKEQGGFIIRINKPNINKSEHHTENSMDDYKFDFVVTNDSSFDDLKLSAFYLSKDILEKIKR